MISIGGHLIGDGYPCFIVAEIGTSHGGDLGVALESIRQAKAAGADAVKFQGFLADHIVPQKHPDYAFLKKTEIPEGWYPELLRAGKEHGTIVFSTASNEASLGWMEELGFPCYKIASGSLTHLSLIRKAAATRKPLIMSTGYATIGDIERALWVVHEGHNFSVALLHCVGNYPATAEELNLRAMMLLRETFGYQVGYSDHRTDTSACEVAAAMGACIIEKHFAIGNGGDAEDMSVSAGPAEFTAMCFRIRRAEVMMGRAVKEIGAHERANAAKARRTLHAARDIAVGEIISDGNILHLRPLGRSESMTGKIHGLPPAAVSWVVGRKARRRILEQMPIHWQDLEIPDAQP